MEDQNVDKILLESKKLDLQMLEVNRDICKIRWERLTNADTLVAFCISVLIAALTSVSCYGCYKVYDLDSQLHSQGLRRVKKTDAPVEFGVIVPEEKK